MPRAKNPIVKEASIVPHMLHRPSEHGVGERYIAWVEMLEFQEGDNALRDTVNVDGIGLIVKVPGWRRPRGKSGLGRTQTRVECGSRTPSVSW